MMLLKIVLLLYALLAVFVAGGLFFKKENYAYRLLALFVWLLGIEMIDFVYSTSALRQITPAFFARYYFLVGFLYGPVLWFHLQFLFAHKKRFVLKDAWHLLPLLIAFVYFFDIFMLPGPARIDYMQAHFLDRVMPLNYARAIHLLVYGIWLIVFIRQRHSSIKGLQRVYTLGVVSIYFLTSVLISWLTVYANDWNDFVWYYLIIATLVLLIAYLLYSQPDFLLQLGKKYTHSGISQEDMSRISSRITEALQTRQLYLNKALSLKMLSQNIGEKPHHLSQTFTLFLKDSFHDHINKYRIEHAKKLLRHPDAGRFTIEAIALDSGFNNKVTFNKAFLKFAGMRPSEYRPYAKGR